MRFAREQTAVQSLITRRRLLAAGAAVAAGAAYPVLGAAREREYSLRRIPLAVDRITGITVCTRPFRGAGPRLEIERIGRQDIVHHYGHGGSGWSLSWGSGEIAAELALRTGARSFGVIGCGAIGLTTALQLQRMGASEVTIYAKDTPPDVRSSWATGGWTPDSRICLESAATPAFKQQWQRMARRSWHMFQGLLGLPGDPVGFVDGYSLSDKPPSENGESEESAPREGRPRFARLARELVPEINLRAATIDPADTPFRREVCSAQTSTDIQRGYSIQGSCWRTSALLAAGWSSTVSIPLRISRSCRTLTVVNATGYGARALMGDESVVPVKGQLARLMPTPEAFYGLSYRRVSLTTRHDITVLQAQGVDANTEEGFNDASEEPDLALAEFAIRTLASAYRAGAA